MPVVSFVRLHFCSNNTGKISIIFEDLLRNSVYFRTGISVNFHWKVVDEGTLCFWCGGGGG